MKTRLIALWYLLTSKKCIVIPFTKCADGGDGYKSFIIGDVWCSDMQGICQNEYKRAGELMRDGMAQESVMKQVNEILK